ncbi:MAG: hypothetical protein J6W64_00330 [Bacilli bacterium]|nr:hypothetical protein [Bacilli bacterium]
MPEILEIAMLICFGISWPINLRKAYINKSTKGISLFFYLAILVGYIAGIISKFLNEAYMASFSTKWYVLIFYFVNLIVVSLNILVYFRNKRIEAKENLN